MRTIRFEIVEGDVLDYQADVVALKYAQAHHGADREMAKRLVEAGVHENAMQPADMSHSFVDTQDRAKAPTSLFIGLPNVDQFTHSHMRQFMQQAFKAIHGEAPGTRHLAMTVHGPRIGLGDREPFLAQFLVCLAEAQTGSLPLALERVTIVERNPKRLRTFRHAMELFIGHHPGVKRAQGAEWGYELPVGSALNDSTPHVFVAMPFNSELDDDFYFGIQWPIIGAGLLCDRVDRSLHFRGDIVDRIKQRIKSAALVLAMPVKDRPNVYYEAGYADALGKPPLFLVKESEKAQLQFDIRTDRCLFYRDYRDLREHLAREISQVLTQQAHDDEQAVAQSVPTLGGQA